MRYGVNREEWEEKVDSILKLLQNGNWSSTAKLAYGAKLNFYETLDILYDLHDQQLVEIDLRGRWKYWKIKKDRAGEIGKVQESSVSTSLSHK